MLRDAPAVIGENSNRPRMQLCTAQMVASLATLMAGGVIRRTDPHALASVIAGAIMNAAAWGAGRADAAGGMRAAGEVVDHLLDGLEVSPA